MRFALALTSCLLLICGLCVAHADKRVALVIGNGAYKNAPALLNPGNDAQDIGQSLRELGFSTIVATDLDRAGINDALDRFSRTVGGAEIALVYYSGHGMQFAGKNFLLPVDARLENVEDVNRFRLIPVEDVFDVLQDALGARIVILDACRNNPVENDLKLRAASTRGANRDALLTRGLSRVAANGLIVAYATQANDVASDGTGRNSPFATAFLHNLGTPDLDLRQMLFNVQDEVDRLTEGKQRPELSISLVGQYKLKPATGARANQEARDNKEVVAPPPDPAAQAWAVTRDTISRAVLEDFIRQFGNTVYGSMARARLEELKKPKVAAVESTVHIPDITRKNIGPYDGFWQVTQTNNKFCKNSPPVVTLRIKIENSRILATRERNPGQVDGNGSFTYEDSTRRPGNFKRVSGKFAGASGNGSFYVVGGRCAGTVVLKRLEPAQITKQN